MKLPENLLVNKAIIQYPGDPDVGIHPCSTVISDLGLDLGVFAEEDRQEHLENVRQHLVELGALINDTPCDVYFDFESPELPTFRVLLVESSSTIFATKLLRHLMGLNIRDGLRLVKEGKDIELFLKDNRGGMLIPPVMSWEQATHLRAMAHALWREWQWQSHDRYAKKASGYPPVTPNAPERLPTIEIVRTS